MGTSVALRAVEGANLMLAAQTFQIPKKLGTRDLGGNLRATLTKKFEHLFDILSDEKVSPLYEEEGFACFGPKSNWKKGPASRECSKCGHVDVDKEAAYVEVDRKLKTTVELTGSAKEGLYWILVLWAHPESDYLRPPGWQREVVWPLVKQIERTKSLEEEIGLNKNEVIEVKDDAQLEKEKMEAESKKDEKECEASKK